MANPACDPQGAWRLPPATVAIGTVAVLALFNVVRAMGVFGDFADAANVGLLVTLMAAAWVLRVPAASLGTTRSGLGSGARWGLGTMALIAAVLAVVALVPTTAGLLSDSRADITTVELGGEVVFGILIATVLPEEFAFRGLLLGAALAAWSRPIAVMGTSVIFGLWHIAPTLATMGSNATASDLSSTTLGTVAIVVGNVVVTTIAGVVFALLRIRSTSLLAPVLAHLGTNATALIAAWVLLNT